MAARQVAWEGLRMPDNVFHGVPDDPDKLLIRVFQFPSLWESGGNLSFYYTMYSPPCQAVLYICSVIGTSLARSTFTLSLSSAVLLFPMWDSEQGMVSRAFRLAENQLLR